MATKKSLTAAQRKEILTTLRTRFEKNPKRHKDVEWSKVQAKLVAHPNKLWSLNEMETTGGEPDVVGYHKKSGEYLFFDCSEEAPKGRRSVCYDKKTLSWIVTPPEIRKLGGAIIADNRFRASLRV